MAATVTTPEQFAGEKLDALALLLPAATTTDAPRERAELIAFCVVVPQDPPPPSEMLITLAGLAFAGTPATAPPDAQTIASAMSEVKPPHLPSTRAGTTFALNATPATPLRVVGDRGDRARHVRAVPARRLERRRIAGTAFARVDPVARIAGVVVAAVAVVGDERVAR